MTIGEITSPSPAQRYAAARRRAATPRFTEFAAGYDFPLDPFQVEACRALEEGKSVLVAAPTGAGKTVVGEFAVHLALAGGVKCFYTTPIKALSNQKYLDFVRRHGPDRVGLLTGDNTINGEAPIVVMTTEVLRNMLYAGSSTLTGLGYVVMDEVHYLGDRFRGGVWEEVIINLPESVRLVALSATVSNAEEFGEWLITVRGATEVIVDEHRPVPLWQHMLVGHRLFDLFVEVDGERRVNPHLIRATQEAARRRQLAETRRHRSRQHGRRRPTASRVEIVERLDAQGLLPAIIFIFSRNGCDQAVEECLRSGLRLNRPEEADEVQAIAEARVAGIADGDLRALGYGTWVEGLRRGIAAHHAGMLPIFKETVEELFAAGLVKVVFATETLALGINMPARTVVLERLIKWNGEEHTPVTPGEYTQLTGRAGRRGIDVEGHAVVCWAEDVDPGAVAGLASRRTYPLRSSFRPSYNMAVNLVGQVGRERAHALLEASFAQFQADRAVVGLTRQIRRNEATLAEYQRAMQCHLGDFAEYAALRRELSDVEAAASRETAQLRRAAAAESLLRLRPGDIVALPMGRRGGLAVVLDTGLIGGEARPVVLTEERRVKRLTVVDVRGPIEPVGRLRIPRSFNPRSAADRRDLAAGLRSRQRDGVLAAHRERRTATGYEERIADLRAALRRHPCHGCTDREEHARWANRSWQLEREIETLRRRVEGRTGSLARTFDRVCDVLGDLGYLAGEDVTEDGRRLARLYTELDLVAAECLRRGVWSGLTPAELAGAVAVLVYEPREDEPAVVRLPAGRLAEACARTIDVWRDLTEVEQRHRLNFLREPSPRFVTAAYRWARGADLETILVEQDMSAGDFVRWTRQLVDLLGQIEQAADGDLRAVAAAAAGSLRRGVVDYTPVA